MVSTKAIDLKKRVEYMKNALFSGFFKLMVFLAFFASSFFVWGGGNTLSSRFCSGGSAKASIPEDSMEMKTAFENIKSGNYLEAQKSFQKILELDPNNRLALSGLSAVFMHLKDYGGVTAINKRMLAINPADPAPYRNIGDAFLGQEKWKDARVWYEKANDLGLEDTLFLNHLAMSCSMSGDPKSAVVFLIRALKIEKEPASYENLGMVYIMLENYIAAQEVFSEALKMDPSDLDVLSKLGSAQFMAGNHQDGIDTLKAVLKQSPQNSTARKNLGTFYLATKDYDAALSCLREAVKNEPNDANIYNSLGMAYWGKNDKSNAKLMFHKAMSLDPGNKKYKHQLELSSKPKP